MIKFIKNLILSIIKNLILPIRLFRVLIKIMILKRKTKLSGIGLHSAGAIIIHVSKFDRLPTPINKIPSSHSFEKKWVNPYYTEISYSRVTDKFTKKFLKLCKKVTPEIVARLLGDFDWRNRKMGAIFCAVKQYTQFQELISNLFLKSELCFVGYSYCVALANFDNEESVLTLKKYLNYYLHHQELEFNQYHAMQALIWLDQKNETNHHLEMIPLWEAYTGKPYDKLSVEYFDETMQYIKYLRNNTQKPA